MPFHKNETESSPPLLALTSEPSTRSLNSMPNAEYHTFLQSSSYHRLWWSLRCCSVGRDVATQIYYVSVVVGGGGAQQAARGGDGRSPRQRQRCDEPRWPGAVPDPTLLPADRRPLPIVRRTPAFPTASVLKSIISEPTAVQNFEISSFCVHCIDHVCLYRCKSTVQVCGASEINFWRTYCSDNKHIRHAPTQYVIILCKKLLSAWLRRRVCLQLHTITELNRRGSSLQEHRNVPAPRPSYYTCISL